MLASSTYPYNAHLKWAHRFFLCLIQQPCKLLYTTVLHLVSRSEISSIAAAYAFWFHASCCAGSHTSRQSSCSEANTNPPAKKVTVTPTVKARRRYCSSCSAPLSCGNNTKIPAKYIAVTPTTVLANVTEGEGICEQFSASGILGTYQRKLERMGLIAPSPCLGL